MKILFLASRYPYPLDKGDKLRLFHQISHISKYHEVHLIALNDREVSTDELTALETICTTVEVIVIPEYRRSINVLKRCLTQEPLQVSYFYDKGAKRDIDFLIETISPDHIFVQLVRMAPYVRDIQIPKSLDYMDSLVLNWRDHPIDQMKYLPVLKQIERNRILKYERQVFDWFDTTFVISERDRQFFSDDIKEGIIIVPNGVDSEYFEPLPFIEKDFDLVFCGNLGYRHNDLAAHFLIDEIMSHMSADISLLVGGSNPSAWVNIKQRTNIRVLGGIEDIRQYYQSGKIFVAPIFSGSGQQNKILEAMAQGLPCITTTFVNESIGATMDEHLLIADSAKEFIAQIEALLSDEALYTALSLSGRRFVKEHFLWFKSIEPILDAIE